MEGDIQRDITKIYLRKRRDAIDYLTSWTPGIAGPVSNRKLREWGYYKFKKLRMYGGWY
jgi:hypothetical protein